MKAKKVTLINKEQYLRLQCPVARLNPQQPVPSSEELFEYIVEKLVFMKLMGYGEADPFRGHIPNEGLFLPILPRFAEMNLKSIMSKVEVKGKKGESFIDMERLTNTVEVPEGPYLLCGIKDGRERLNATPSDAKENIAKEDRSGLTTTEGIFLSILFPWVLKNHNIDLCGSAYGMELTPCLYLFKDKKGKPFNGTPILHALYDIRGKKWGVPSCVDRKSV